MSVRSTQLDKRSLSESGETAGGWLRASGVERGRPDRAVAWARLYQPFRSVGKVRLLKRLRD